MVTLLWIIALVVIGFVSFVTGRTYGYNEGWAMNQSLHTKKPVAPKGEVAATAAVVKPVRKVTVATAAKKTTKPVKKAKKASRKGKRK